VQALQQVQRQHAAAEFTVAQVAHQQEDEIGLQFLVQRRPAARLGLAQQVVPEGGGGGVGEDGGHGRLRAPSV